MSRRRIGSRRSYCAILLAIISLASGYRSTSSQLLAQQSAPRSSARAPQKVKNAAVRPAAKGVGATALAFEGVTVVDVSNGRLLRNQTVVVTRNRVQAVGPASQIHIPKGAQVVDARGKYLIPGLWDMHTHIGLIGSDDLAFQDSLYRANYPLYVANGVTGIREMAQRFPNGADSFRAWQRQVAAGTRVGPRTIGPSADLTYNLELETPEDARRIIDSLKAAGDAFVKFHDEAMEPKLYFTILREARRVGLPLVGHVPKAVPNVEAVDSGHLGVEHIIRHYQCVQRPDKAPLPADSLEQECAAVAQAYIRNGTWLTPTIAVDYYIYFTGSNPQVFRDYQKYLRTLHRLGVRRFLTGTDCGTEWMAEDLGLNPVCHRGFSVLQDLVFLAESGLPPLEALQAATLNPARYLNATDSLGTVTPGKLADLVLLDADPLADIHNVMKIRAVVANGRYFDRAALDVLDPAAVKLVKGFAEQWSGSGGQAGSAKTGSSTP